MLHMSQSNWILNWNRKYRKISILDCQLRHYLALTDTNLKWPKGCALRKIEGGPVLWNCSRMPTITVIIAWNSSGKNKNKDKNRRLCCIGTREAPLSSPSVGLTGLLGHIPPESQHWKRGRPKISKRFNNNYDRDYSIRFVWKK